MEKFDEINRCLLEQNFSPKDVFKSWLRDGKIACSIDVI